VPGGDAYYWAGGRKVPLHGSPDVVVDLASAAVAPLAGTQVEALRAAGRTLSGALLLVARSDAVAALGEQGASGPGVHPVFRSADDSLVVVLPEVRVEASNAAKLAELVRSLTTAHIKEESADRLVLEPDSGRGEDALALANALSESADADLAQARFLRVVPRPGSR
jgi:hypothetical protein